MAFKTENLIHHYNWQKTMKKNMTLLGSAISTVMFLYAIFKQWFPQWHQQQLHILKQKYLLKLLNYFNPYITITFHEYQGDMYSKNKAYKAIERYLSTNSLNHANRLKANVISDCKSVLSLDDNEEVVDEFKGVKMWWESGKRTPQTRSYHAGEEKRYYTLTTHKKHRDLVTGCYIPHVIKEGNAIARKTRQLKLYTNSRKTSVWSYIMFEHPSTFDTLAMDPNKKTEILNDLLEFSKSKEYYKKIGKAWKRGYLLYGPPGSGKSSMIAAIANLLAYDIYDLELTSVSDNSDLRKLLTNTSSKSMIVIEDIDCSLDLTGQRDKIKSPDKKKEDNKVKGPVKKVETKKESEVTLAGLLNFIDGLWSASGGERLIVFTTNHVKKLDPALIRRGRMDKHIEMSYCCFEGFKVLAKNYLDVESHELFGTISGLLVETNMTPADVAENLMPKSPEEDAESCLKCLIKSLEKAKEKARLNTVVTTNSQKVQQSDESKDLEEVKQSDELKDLET